MNLQQLQTGLYTLIKSGTLSEDFEPSYLKSVSVKQNLLLIRKIAIWWRSLHIAQFCKLTSNILKAYGIFDSQISVFFANSDYSAFREEVGLQFLEYVISQKTKTLILSVAKFEMAIIKLRLKEKIDDEIFWNYEPYKIISALLKNNFNKNCLLKGRYKVKVSFHNTKDLFTVLNLDKRSL